MTASSGGGGGAIQEAPRLAEEIDATILEQIPDHLNYICHLTSVGSMGYVSKSEVADWQGALALLTETIVFAYGSRGNDPRTAYSDTEYFLFCSQWHPDFKAGKAIRKSDGAVFSWDLTKPEPARPGPLP